MKNFLKRVATGAILYGLFVAIFLCTRPIFTEISLILILAIIIIFEWPRLCNIKSPKCWLFTLFYPILPFTLLIYMSRFANYRMLLFYMIVITVSHDAGGYIFGNLLGKHKLAPSISPKKTWEGFFGGCILTFFTSYLIFIIISSNIPVWKILPFSFSVSIFATVGDLFESYLKRKAGVKDSGRILPGHGGLLDRFDSFLAVIFLFFVFRNCLVKMVYEKQPMLLF